MIRNLFDYLIIRNSSYFDPAYYLLEYKDVRLADVDPLWHFVKHGWKEGRNPSFRFDTSFYLMQYPDVRDSGINPLVHYIKYGQFEGRAVNGLEKPVLRVPHTQQHINLKRRFDNWLFLFGLRIYRLLPSILRLKIRNWIEFHRGSLLGRKAVNQNWHNTSNFDTLFISQYHLIDLNSVAPSKDSNGSIAIHLHVYYKELAKELSEYLKNMPFKYDLFVSVPDERTLIVCQDVFDDLPLCNNVEIKITPNRGRDIAPFICLFGNKLESYDYIAHLHTKKSLYNKGATIGWREYLFDALLGSEDQIRRIFSLLQASSPLYGIVYPQNYVLLPYWANTWLANRGLANYWSHRLGIKELPKGYFDYPASSMFWAKSRALKQLFQAEITYGDFPEEIGQTDGTLAHTLERLFVLCSLEQGMSPAIIRDNKYPSWSPWRFDQYLSRNQFTVKEILKSNKLKLIGFDVFDTLLIRPLLDPESVKKIVAIRAGDEVGNLYKKFRIIAEIQARQQKGQDVNIDEIYKTLEKISGISELDVNKLKSIEIETEEALLFPRLEGIELYKDALKTGKPVIILTDMFLSPTIIEKFLNSFQIGGWDRLYVSSDVGLRKDDGKLYEYVFREFGTNPEEYVMIGDNERSDVQVPCDMGSSYIHCMKPIELARGLPRLKPIVEQHERFAELESEITLALIINKNFSPIFYPNSFDQLSLIPVSPYNIGYSIVGPLLVSFSDWLYRECLVDGIRKLYFLSREGKIIREVYDWWTENLSEKAYSDYLVISRRGAGVAAIQSFEDILEIARTVYFPNTIQHFLQTRYGVVLNEERWKIISKNTGWDSQKEVRVQEKKVDHLVPLLREIEDEILARAFRERVAMIKYLTDKGMFQNESQAVVDIGYGGSVQGYLNKLLGKKVHGYYLMTDQRSIIVSKIYDVMIKGCFYENVDLGQNTPLMYKYNFDIEKLMSSTDAQVEFYEILDDGQIKGHFRQLDLIELQANPIRDEIRRGVMDFTLDARKIREKVYPQFKPSIWTAKMIIEAFFTNRSKKEIELLSQIVLDDHYCGRGLVNY